MFNDFLGFDIDSLFDVSWKSWNRVMKEVDVRSVVKKDYGYCVIVNALGVAPEDIKLEFKNGYLLINGETKDTEIDFTHKVSNRIIVSKDILNKITDVKYNVRNGYLYIEIYIPQEKPKEINISYKK